MAVVFTNEEKNPNGTRRGLRATRAHAEGAIIASEAPLHTGANNWELTAKWFLHPNAPVPRSAATWPSANGAGLRAWDAEDERSCNAIVAALAAHQPKRAPSREDVRHVYDIMCTNSLCVNPGVWVSAPGAPPPVRQLGYYPMFSMINHACAPNCVLKPAEGRAESAAAKVLVALRPIAASEELTITYMLDTFDTVPVQLRQRELKRDFGFTCACTLCAQQLRAESTPCADP